jgi:hypothetical protein
MTLKKYSRAHRAWRLSGRPWRFAAASLRTCRTPWSTFESSGRGEPEGPGLRIRIADPPAADIGLRDRLSIEYDPERFDQPVPQDLLAHGRTVHCEPGDVHTALAVDGAPLEPPPAAEHRVPVPQGDQLPAELEQLLVCPHPLVPGDLVILALGVVVAELGATDLIPPRSMGTPWDSSSVARKSRCCWARRARTATSSVSPSAPQFQERLSSVPSRFSSPLASLCLRS